MHTLRGMLAGCRSQIVHANSSQASMRTRGICAQHYPKRKKQTETKSFQALEEDRLTNKMKTVIYACSVIKQ